MVNNKSYKNDIKKIMNNLKQTLKVKVEAKKAERAKAKKAEAKKSKRVKAKEKKYDANEAKRAKAKEQKAEADVKSSLFNLRNGNTTTAATLSVFLDELSSQDPELVKLIKLQMPKPTPKTILLSELLMNSDNYESDSDNNYSYRNGLGY